MIYIFGPTTGIKPKKLTMFELILTYIQLIFSVGLMGLVLYLHYIILLWQIYCKD